MDSPPTKFSSFPLLLKLVILNSLGLEVLIWPCSQYRCVCDVTGMLANCAPSWMTTLNIFVKDGVRMESLSTLSDCQSACLCTANCSAFDWFPSIGTGYRCWLHGLWSAGRDPFPRNGAVHYNLMYKCPGEYTPVVIS